MCRMARRSSSSNCVPCHGATGKGGHGEGAPLPNGLSIRRVVTTATNGKGDMPSFEGTLSPDDLRDVANYIVTKLPPR